MPGVIKGRIFGLTGFRTEDLKRLPGVPGSQYIESNTLNYFTPCQIVSKGFKTFQNCVSVSAGFITPERHPRSGRRAVCLAKAVERAHSDRMLFPGYCTASLSGTASLDGQTPA